MIENMYFLENFSDLWWMIIVALTIPPIVEVIMKLFQESNSKEDLDKEDQPKDQ